MIGALYQVIFAPHKAWKAVQEDSYLQQYLLPMLVYPLLIVTALSEYVPHMYGYITAEVATLNALVTIIKYIACIVSAMLMIIWLSRHNLLVGVGKSDIHLFVGYTFTITFLSILVGNLLPSEFAFIQFAPIYSIWVVFQGKDFMKVDKETVFSYTVIASALFLLLPFLWDSLLGIILH